MSVRTTMPPMPPMGGMPGMPGMPMGGMGMAPPAPMGGPMAPMGGAPMGAPMPAAPMPPAPMQAPSASAGTLPSPSSAGQRAGFRQFAGAIQNMRAPVPPMGQAPMAPMGPMGSMPQNIFASPGLMGSTVLGGMPVPALPGRMPDVARRAVGMRDGGLAGVAYMQGGGDPAYTVDVDPNPAGYYSVRDASGRVVRNAATPEIAQRYASSLTSSGGKTSASGVGISSTQVLPSADSASSSVDPEAEALIREAALARIKEKAAQSGKSVNIKDIREATGLGFNEAANLRYIPDALARSGVETTGQPYKIDYGSFFQSDEFQQDPENALRSLGGSLVQLGDQYDYSDIGTPGAGSGRGEVIGSSGPVTLTAEMTDRGIPYVRAYLTGPSGQNLGEIATSDFSDPSRKFGVLGTGLSEDQLRSLQGQIEDYYQQIGYEVGPQGEDLLGNITRAAESGGFSYGDLPDVSSFVSAGEQIPYSQYLKNVAETDRYNAGLGSSGVVSGVSGTSGTGIVPTGYGSGTNIVAMDPGTVISTTPAQGTNAFTLPGSSYTISPPAGSVYQPTVYDIPRFVSGMSDLYGTRPVTYIGSPEAIASGPLGTINLPARPEQVNIFDWLQGSVIDGGQGSVNFKQGGEVPPRRTDIRGQDHMLAYITPHEAGILKALGGTGEPGPMGIPTYLDPGYGSGGMGDPAGPSGGGQSSGSSAGTGGGGADSGQAAASADADAASDGPGFDAFGNEYGSAAEAAVADAVAEAAAEAANAAMGQAGTGGYGADAAASVAGALGLGPSGPSAQTSAPSQPSMSVVDQLSTMMNPSQPADISLVDPMTSSQFAPTRGQSISDPTAPDTTPAVSMSPASITAMSDIANMVAPENVDDPLGLMSTPAISLSAPEDDQVASRGTGTSQMSVSPAAISDIFAEDVAMSQTVAPAQPGGLSSVAPSMDTAPTGLFSAPAPSAQTDISQPSMPSSFAPVSSIKGLEDFSMDPNTMSQFAPTSVQNINAPSSMPAISDTMPSISLSPTSTTAPSTSPSTSVSTTSQATNVSPETIAEDLAPTTTTPSTTTQTTMTTRPEMRPEVDLSLKDQIDMAITNLTGTLKGQTQEQINEELGKKGYTPAEISMFNATSTNTQRGVAADVENQIGARDEILNEVVTDTGTETDDEEKEKVPFSTGEPYVPETLEEIMARITSPTTLGRRLNVTSGGPNVFLPSGSRPVRMQEGGEPNYRRMARDFATEYGVDPDIFTKLVIRESGFNPNAKSEKGAFGLTQVMPDTARKPGFGVKPLENMNDPREQLRFGAEYLSAMLKEFGGDYPQALAAYNAGVGAVRDAGGVPNFDETRKYVDYILGTTRPKARPGSVSPAPDGVTRPRVRPENLADLLASLERPRVPSRSLRPQMRPAPTISSQDRFAQLDAAASGKDSLGMAVDSFLKSMAAE